MVELARSGLSRNEVARRAEVSTATVSRVAAAAGVAFDRSRTKNATKAKVADAKARRAQLSLDLLDDVEHVRSVLRGTDRPQGLMHSARAVSELVNSHTQLVAVDASDDTDLDHSKSMLGMIFTGIQTWHTGQQEGGQQ
ncbi:transposase [Spinactinospora alkalitolerans]|uniref:Transposase n=1 Tax=Spinactinospora alkalitolerans TaxID=687207 RepID=A0A852U099_9ACTN|nr:hypothetical protein [Spinactinospora alkalitolerans]NYE50246.1 transposase [Spinactinospora alkalitolerans]